MLLDALGHCTPASARRTRARELLEAAAKAAPDEPRARFHLGALYARTGEAGLARTELKAAVESGRPFPERLDALRLLRDDAAAAPTTPDPSVGRPRP
jgi:hypothetical protein